MKRWLMVAGLAVAAGAALYYSERQNIQGHVGPEAVINKIAGVERQISRIPAQVVRLTDQEEIQAGDSMAAGYAYRSRGATEADAALENYVNAIGQQVASRARRQLNYRFHYIPDNNFINAFALPGGHIFLGKGLMLLMHSEDELASVLGHEVEHIDQYHCNERVSLEARLRRIPLSGLIQLPIEIFQAGYSKEQEMEADRNGTQLAVLAGYSPQGAIDMFQAFDRLHKRVERKADSPDQEIAQVALDTVRGYFRSHPLPEERIQQIQSLIASQKWPEKQERPLKTRPQ
ncbi:MAG TPA: M48 family metalloprotease [Candidatus Saccharimonadales bacterium]|jgi:predicted Zn-dependent protease|nr:M48 family metalloprotease [Candidatus Saccharimonadales bacterium]